jgi:phosphatidylinositol 4-kinase
MKTLKAELGLFNHRRVEVSPLAVDEEMRKHLRPYLADIRAHDIWIRFVYERIEIAKYCSQEQIYMFTQVRHRKNFGVRTFRPPDDLSPLADIGPT